MEVWWLLSPPPAALLRQPVRLTSLRSGLKAAAAAVGEWREVKGRSGGEVNCTPQDAAATGEKFSSQTRTHMRAVETLGDSHSAAATSGVCAEKQNLHICLGSI